MTEQSNVERAVQEPARETGRRHAHALADLEQISRSPFVPSRPVDLTKLNRHLETRYGIAIASLAPIDDNPDTRPRGSWPGHYPSTLLVRHRGGGAWVCRVSSSAADQIDRVHGDADILRFLASHGLPAERIASDAPVSTVDGHGLIVTEFVEGGRPTDGQGRAQSPAVFEEMGRLLGQLHTLPRADGAVSRDGGAEGTDGGFYVGRPRQDLAAAMSFLVSVEDRVPAEGRQRFAWLSSQVESADDAEGLPEALTHSNYHVWSAVGAPGNLVIVGWAGAGRGPRLPALAWLLRTAAEGSFDNLEAVMRGYRVHVELTREELDRLPAILNLRALWLACLEYRMAIESGQNPSMGGGWLQPGSAAHAERLAARVRAASAPDQ